MKVATEHMMALCAALEGNGEAFERMTAGVNEEHLAPLSALLAAAFFSAARMRFAAGWSVTGVIRFVARMRVRHGQDLDDAFSPSLAEALLLSVLAGTPLAGACDEAVKAYTQAALLRALADDLGEQSLYALLDHARQQADGWLTRVLGSPLRGQVGMSSERSWLRGSAWGLGRITDDPHVDRLLREVAEGPMQAPVLTVAGRDRCRLRAVINADRP